MDKDYPDERNEAGVRKLQMTPKCPSCGTEVDCDSCPRQQSYIFRKWLRNFDGLPKMYDNDLILWRRIDGILKPLAVLELTKNDRINSPPKFFDSILKRLRETGQYEATEEVAKALGVNAYIIVFHEGLQQFDIYKFSGQRWAHRLNQAEIIQFIGKGTVPMARLK